jgi:uncharacterized membrane protein
MARTPRASICQVCKRQLSADELVPAAMVRDPVARLIEKDNPDWSADGYICRADLGRYRAQYMQDVIEAEKGELSAIEREIVKSFEEEELVSKDVDAEFERRLTMGERMADRVADFGGSWKFIGLFAGVLVLWIIMNTLVLLYRPFDPYPFILLNLVLSCIAAIQAPVIMMSQNRQEAKDRQRARHDYQVNLKAEVEIRNLHEKIDHLIFKQWQRLLEIQEIQMDLLEDILKKTGGKV